MRAEQRLRAEASATGQAVSNFRAAHYKAKADKGVDKALARLRQTTAPSRLPRSTGRISGGDDNDESAESDSSLYSDSSDEDEEGRQHPPRVASAADGAPPEPYSLTVFVLYARIEATTTIPGHPELVETVTVGDGKKLYVCH